MKMEVKNENPSNQQGKNFPEVCPALCTTADSFAVMTTTLNKGFYPNSKETVINCANDSLSISSVNSNQMVDVLPIWSPNLSTSATRGEAFVTRTISESTRPEMWMKIGGIATKMLIKTGADISLLTYE
jgi:hypothetical protein